MKKRNIGRLSEELLHNEVTECGRVVWGGREIVLHYSIAGMCKLLPQLIKDLANTIMALDKAADGVSDDLFPRSTLYYYLSEMTAELVRVDSGR